MGGGSARVGCSAARPAWRRLALAAGRRLPRSRHAARRPRQHASPAPARARRRARGRNRGRSAQHAFRENGLANWPGSPRRQLAVPGRGIRLQWCTGAPGVLAGAWKYLDEELVLAGAELVWRAGAHGDEKGHGICHGTSGNGFALLKAFARTGDERWLERARRFAVHALGQVERLRAANGRGRYSLWTGDLGTALFGAACLECDASYPISTSSSADPPRRRRGRYAAVVAGFL